MYHSSSHRLRGYDYARPCACFLTINTHGAARLFGRIRSGRFIPSDIGRVVRRCWHEIPDHFPKVHLDAFVVMPHHLHGILWIADDEYEDQDLVRMAGIHPHNRSIDDTVPPPASPYAEIDPRPIDLGIPDAFRRYPAQFSMMTLDGNAVPFQSPSRTIGSIVRGFKIGVTKWVRTHTSIVRVWQPNYWDVIIRDARHLRAVRRYIFLNPRRWRG